MKKTVVLLSLVLIAALLCACAPAAADAEMQAHSGEYTLFAVSYGGYVMSGEDFDMASVLTLTADGKGYLTINDEGGDVSKWSVDGDRISVSSGVSTLEGTIEDGIITLDYGEDVYCYYALPDADVSGIELISIEDVINQIGAELVQ